MPNYSGTKRQARLVRAYDGDIPMSKRSGGKPTHRATRKAKRKTHRRVAGGDSLMIHYEPPPVPNGEWLPWDKYLAKTGEEE